MARQWEYCRLEYSPSESEGGPVMWGAYKGMPGEDSDPYNYDPEVDLRNDYLTTLAELGLLGWELVCAFQSDHAFAGEPMLLLKRPVETGSRVVSIEQRQEPDESDVLE